jgi:hypothetical protein
LPAATASSKEPISTPTAWPASSSFGVAIVHDDGLRLRELAEPREHGLRRRGAVAVVRDDDRVEVARRLLDRPGDPGRDPGLAGPVAPLVEAEDLLLLGVPVAREDARLRDRRARRLGDAVRLRAVLLGEEGAEVPPALVGAEEAERVDLGAEGGEVLDGVAGAAGEHLLALAGDDDHGRLARDPLGAAVDVDVRDEVAHDADPAAGELVREGAQVVGAPGRQDPVSVPVAAQAVSSRSCAWPAP